MPPNLSKAIEMLNTHYEFHTTARHYAVLTDHTVPSDTKSWSEILITLLTGIPGRARKKGSDLIDGSDVKAANVWDAIDTPRFNGCAPAGRTSSTSSKPSNVSALNGIPYLFFALWDTEPIKRLPRCRVWVVSPPHDVLFRQMVSTWYQQRHTGHITSTNFQLHPPRDKNSNQIRNKCGNLSYPLLFSAERPGSSGYQVVVHNPSVLVSGSCK